MTNPWDGRPQNPERDSEGHVWRMDGEVDVYRWVAGNQWYEDRKGRWVIPADLLADGDTYLGRIVHPAEVEARVAAARREALEEAAKIALRLEVPADAGPIDGHARVMASVQIAAAIRALAKEVEG